MLFSHRPRFDFDDEMISSMALGHVPLGHSCLRIWTTMRLSLLMKAVRSRALDVCRYAVAAGVLLLLAEEEGSSSEVDEILMTTPTTKFRMPERWSAGSAFHRVVMRLFMICRARYCEHDKGDTSMRCPSF